MISRTAVLIASLTVVLALLGASAGAAAAEPDCETEPRAACFGIESVKASLSTTQAGAHPDLSLDVAIKQDPTSPTNAFGLHNTYAATRDIRFDIPPGLIGDPNALGAVQQCSAQQLISFQEPGGGCPTVPRSASRTSRPTSLNSNSLSPPS